MSTEGVTSSIIYETNNSVMSGDPITTSSLGDRVLQDHGRAANLTPTVRNGHSSSQFMSNQLIPYDNPSPEPPSLDIAGSSHILGTLDFSYPPSSKPQTLLHQHLRRSQSLPPAHALHTTPFANPDVDSERGACVSNETSAVPWYNSGTNMMAPESKYSSLRRNGSLHKSEYNPSTSSTPDSHGDAGDVKTFTPEVMYTTGQHLENPTFTHPYKTEPGFMGSPYNDRLGLGEFQHGVVHHEQQHFDEGSTFRHNSGLNGKQPSEMGTLRGLYMHENKAPRLSDSRDSLEPLINEDGRYDDSNFSNSSSSTYSGQQSSAFMHSSQAQQFHIPHLAVNAADLERHGFPTPPLLSPSPASVSSFSKQTQLQMDTNTNNPNSGPANHSSGKSNIRSSSTTPKSAKPSRGAQNLPPCRVCGNKASGLHFGVNTCEACNEFFRRSLKRGASYYCTKNRECQVYGKKRNACSFCRYHRCVEMGMSRDAIKTGRYSHKTRTEYAMEVEEFKQKEMNRAEMEKFEVLLNDLVKYHDKYINVTTRIPYEELHKKQSAYLELFNTQREHELRHPPLSTTIHRNKRLLTCWQAEKKEDLTLTMHDVEMTEVWLRNYIHYAKNVPGFKELALSDQASLVRGSWFEFWFIGAYRGYNSNLGIVFYPNGRCFHKDEIQKVFGKEYTDYSFYLADRMRTLDVSPEEKVLIKTVCLTFPDRTPLQNKEAVEKMHWLMVSCLLHTLERNRPGDTYIFPLIVSKLVELRNLTDIAMRAHKSALFQDVLKDSPLLCEMVDTKTLYVQCSAHKNGVQTATECAS